MIELERRDREYLIHSINYASGIPVYTLEAGNRMVRAVSVLSEQDSEDFNEKLKNMVVHSADPYVELQLDIVPKKSGWLFGLIVGLGAPRS